MSQDKNLKVVGAHISSQGLRQGEAGGGRTMSLPTTPKRPTLPKRLTRKLYWRRYLAWLPHFITRRYVQLTPQEQETIAHERMVGELCGYFGAPPRYRLDHGEVLAPFTSYLFLVFAKKQRLTLRDFANEDARLHLQTRLKRHYDPFLHYSEILLQTLLSYYRRRHHAMHGQPLKISFFADLAAQALAKMPTATDFRLLRQQANSARQQRRAQGERQQIAPAGTIEAEYQHTRSQLAMIIHNIQLSIMFGYPPRQELIQLLDYIPPAWGGWFVMHDNSGQLAQLFADKLDFLAARRRVSKSSPRPLPAKGKGH
jgi:hypothetical protein